MERLKGKIPVEEPNAALLKNPLYRRLMRIAAAERRKIKKHYGLAALHLHDELNRRVVNTLLYGTDKRRWPS